MKFKWLSELVTLQCDFGLWLVDKESFKEYPDISRRDCLHRGQGVSVNQISVHGCEVTVCVASGIRV